MTTEERLVKLEEAMLVNASLLNRLDQRGEGHREWLEEHNAAIRKHDEEIGDLRSGLLMLNSALGKTHTAVEKLRSVIEAHEDGIVELRAFQTSVLERLDRFIQGREGNGRKQ